ncbi:MAG: 1-acyl-sn-glycerol-3-phosphate acyltransferase [Pseudomonadota bacterium]
MGKFASIRPYLDEEVSGVLHKLVNDKELLDTLLAMRHPSAFKVAPAVMRTLARRFLKRNIQGVTSTDEFQQRLLPHALQLLSATTDSLTISGLEGLDPQSPHLYLSNHRDIAMDSLCLSVMLNKNGFVSPRTAIGSNLLDQEFVGRLMRLNKCFIVPRGIMKPRERFAALRDLSAYIRHSITMDQHPVWIAQREGRAKDGFDRTDETIIKMLMMSATKGAEFETGCGALNLVPVSISYEYDPCELLKANELIAIEKSGSYEKDEGEDTDSIFIGIEGQNGRVHIEVGTPLSEIPNLTDSAQVTAELDRQIVANYVLFPNSYFAHELLGRPPVSGVCLPSKQPFAASDFEAERDAFSDRLERYNSTQRKRVLETYANPIQNKLDLGLMS